MEKLNNGRSKITMEGNTTKLTIPVKRNYLIIIFSLIWLLIWFSFFSSFNSTFGLFNDYGIDTFFMIWLTFWIIGGLAVMFLLLWNLFGKESIVLNNKHLELNRNLFGIGRKKQYDRRHLKNFRFNEIPDNMFSMKNRLAFWGLGEGKVKFDYGMKSPSFGLSLEDAESNYIVKLMKEKSD
jgi:hypothetical protein